jgi:CheY-like chemotaxis protein
MDGSLVARRLRKIVPDARLLASRGYGQGQDGQRSTAAGFHAHLLKAMDRAKLNRALEDRH